MLPRTSSSKRKWAGLFLTLLLASKKKDREELIGIINDFDGKGLDCVILACTDLQLLIPKHPTIRTFDTMKILADATVERILT